MLKQKIDKAAFDALPDVMKAEYKANPTNAAEYLLDAEEAREAISARDREKARADGLQTQIDAINAQLNEAKTARETAEAEAAKKKGDIPAIEASWKTKLDEATAAAKVREEKLMAQLKALLVHDQAVQIANAISTVPSLMVPVIEARLSAEIDGDKPFTRVLDATGKPSALSLDDLRKEIVANTEYATIIKANDATGGGAGGATGGGGASGKKFSDMTEAEKRSLNAANPAEFQRLSNEARAAANKNRRR